MADSVDYFSYTPIARSVQMMKNIHLSIVTEIIALHTLNLL